MRSFDQPQHQILGRILNPQVVLRHAAFGGDHFDRAGVGKHPRLAGGLRETHIAKTDGLRERRNCRLFAGQEVPTLRGVHAAVALHIERLFGRGHRRSFGGIDTRDNNLEVFARCQVHHLECSDQAIQVLHAQDLALVVDQGKDYGFLAEVISQLDNLARLVSK